jgi:superfamily II RNA helicase
LTESTHAAPPAPTDGAAAPAAPLAAAPLAARLRALGHDASPDAALDAFLGYVAEAGLTLYPAQEQALLELASGKHVVLQTPTGSGKSLVASFACFLALATGRRAFWTCPIKALVGEKFFDLCRLFGPEEVGLMTGDATVNRDAPVVCCTAEILANVALAGGERAPVDTVVMDEFHYYGDEDRGAAWQIPLLTLPQARFLLMSATLGDTSFFERDLTRRTGVECVAVRGGERPVPLSFEWSERPLHETIADLVEKGRAPIYLVGFTQRGAAEAAQALMSTDFSSKAEKRAIADALAGVRFPSPYGKELARYLRHGIGLHHAGLLPRYRLLVEKLAQRGLLKVVSGTDTLGVGVNVPIRTVLFTRLYKFDGKKTALLTVRDFQQIAGRAGRKGFDDHGFVVVQAPEHVIENARREAKAGGDPKKLRKLERAKPPDRYVHYDASTLERLRTGQPEPLVSRFEVTHAMLAQVLGRPEGGCAAMKRLVRECHDPPSKRRDHARHARALLRSLHDTGYVALVPRPGAPHLRDLVLREGLGDEVSLFRTLSLWMLDAMKRLDPWSETYALDVLSIVEATLESPDVVLLRQTDRLKTEKLAELKASGVEYEERMAELEKIEHPRPLAEFIWETFDAFAARHPWARRDAVRPKSIAREMFERFSSFDDYVRDYDLHRVEGVLLRYLTDCYKALVQGVPASMRTDELDDVVTYLGAIVRGTDASLLEEWERMRSGDEAAILAAEAEREDPTRVAKGAPDVTRDRRAFTVMVRNARGRYEEAVEAVEGSDPPWSAVRLEQALRPYLEEHGPPRVDAFARLPARTRITEEGPVWRVEQVLCDAEDVTDRALELEVDLARAREAGRPLLALRGLV